MAKKNSRKSVTKNLATSYFTVKKTRRHAVRLSEKQVPMKIEGVRMKRSRWVAEIKHPEKKNVRMWIGSYATQEEASKAYQRRKMEHEEMKFKDAVKKDKFVGDQEVEALCDDRDVEMNGIDGEVVCDDQVMKDVDFDGEKNGPLHSKKEGIVRICLDSYAAHQSKEMEHGKLKLRAIARKDKVVDDQEVVSGQAESNAESLPDNSDVVVKLAKLAGFDDANFVDVLKESHGETQCDDWGVLTNVIGSDDQAMEVIHIDYQAERSLSRRIVEQEAGDMLLQSGPILIDRYGCLLGEFSWMDDLSIDR